MLQLPRAAADVGHLTSPTNECQETGLRVEMIRKLFSGIYVCAQYVPVALTRKGVGCFR
jgi:hypothetical protein